MDAYVQSEPVAAPKTVEIKNKFKKLRIKKIKPGKSAKKSCDNLGY